VKTALKGTRFQDGEDIKKNVMAELNAVPLEACAVCFQKLFKGCHKLRWAGITLNLNRIIFDFFAFYIYFSTPIRGLYCQTT
jgi:hypothetical protein